MRDNEETRRLPVFTREREEGDRNQKSQGKMQDERKDASSTRRDELLEDAIRPGLRDRTGVDGDSRVLPEV